MTAAFKAAVLYAALVFAAGFVLGALRVIVVEPAFGALPAVLLELPVMLAVSWLVCATVIRHCAVTDGIVDRLAMGALAFALLMSAETLLGLAFGKPLSAQLTAYATLAGLFGLAGQTGFALIPLIQKFIRNA